MIGSLGDVSKIPELRKRVLFVISMLAVYRFGVFVSTPGVDILQFRSLIEDSAGGRLFGMVNLFSGGSFENLSIFALGIMPYISVAILMQFLTPVIPALDSLKKEGQSGQRAITRYTRQGTIVLALIQSFAVISLIEGNGLAVSPGWQFRITTMITLTAGTAFLMWVGEQITEKGIGNGISIIIFANIIAAMPQELFALVQRARNGDIEPLSVLFILGFCALTIAAIVYVERSFRRIPVQYPRRVGKNAQQQPQTQYLPLKINMAGVIPPIFAYTVLGLPVMFSTFLPDNELLADLAPLLVPGEWGYLLVFIPLIFFFCYYCTATVYSPDEVSENLKKNGGFIPTVRPGKQTSDFLYGVVNRLTFVGSIYICLVCLIPDFFYRGMGADSFAFIFGGTAVLIVVGVTLDTASQIEAHVVAKNYEAFMSRSSKVKAGLGAMSAGSLRARLRR